MNLIGGENETYVAGFAKILPVISTNTLPEKETRCLGKKQRAPSDRHQAGGSGMAIRLQNAAGSLPVP